MQIILKKEFGKLEDYIYTNARRTYNKMPVELSTNDLLSPTNDEVFKMMFTYESSKEFACLLFTQILKADYNYLVENLKLYPTEFSKKDRNQTSIRGDGNFVIDDVFISLEMNNANTIDRNMEYAHRLYSSKKERKKTRKGKTITYTKYADVIQFNIHNLTYRGLDKTIDVRVTEADGVRKSRIIYIDVYLPNIYKKYKEYGQEKLSESERIILTMFIAKEEEIKKLLRKEDIMLKEFIDRLRSLKENGGLFKRYEKETSWVIASREEGEQIGLEKGRNEEKIETAKSMLQDGISEEKVQKYTRLPAQEIKKIITML